MAKSQIVSRDYSCTDAELEQRADVLALILERDLPLLAVRNITTATISAFQTLITNFKNVTPDRQMVGLVSEKAEDKLAKRNVLRIILEDLRSMVENTWPKSGSQRSSYDFDNMSQLTDADFARLGRFSASQATLHLSALANEGLTTGFITDLTAKESAFDDSIDEVKLAVSTRRHKTEDRIIKGNLLFAELVRLCNTGTTEFSHTAPVKLPDYRIYLGIDTPSSPPDPPLEIALAADQVLFTPAANTTSHDVRTSTDGVNWNVIANGITEHFVELELPVTGGIMVEVRSHGPGGVSAWKRKTYVASLTGVTNLRVENETFMWDDDPFAEQYEMRDDFLTDGEKTQVFKDNIKSYTWIPPAGTWTFELRKWAGGVFGPWTILVITVA